SLHFDNASLVTTGAPVLLKNINDYLTGGMLTLGAIALVIMAIILLLLFSVRWRLLPLAIVAVGVVWAFGLAGYLGIPLTIVTIAGLPVMLGIGIDYAIQMHARVEEEVVIDREAHTIQETERNLCPALLVVTFDAIFAFAALRFAKVPMLRQFGLLLAVGLAAICLCSIIAPLAALGIREYKSPTKGRDFRTGPLGRLVVWLGALPGGVAIPLAVASVIIFAGGILVEGKLELQTDPIKWVNQDSQVIHDLHTLDHETGSSSELGVFVQSKDVFDDLEANRVLLTYLAILFVFLFLSVRLRSVIRSLLSLVPVLIAVGTASLVAFAFSLKLSPITAVGGPLVVAACTEFTSLILLRFVEERRRGLTPEEAVEVAASRTRRAFIVSALTAIAGVAVIATSSLPLLRDFG